MSSDVWPVVRAERLALADDLDGLPAEQWETPSLCAGWDVHDVVAHVIDTATTTPLSFARDLVAARFDFHRANGRGIARERHADPSETVARLRAVADRTSSPPAAKESRLVEMFVHGEDIRRPLGIRRDYPQEHVVRALALQARTPASFEGGKTLAAGLRLVADDHDFTHGDGREVRGPAIALLLLMSGRAVALVEVEGDGVAMLAARLV